MPFTFRSLEIPDVRLIEPRVFGDARGWFTETYKRSEFERAGIADEFRQDNHSRSTARGVLRGLHYQLSAAAQAKLVRCTKGEIFDVAVDIRRGSPTYGRWVGERLKAEDHRMLYVPVGFAHGYCTLTDEAEVQYKTSGEYAPALERAIRWDDATLSIPWPVKEPLLSPKDAAAPPLLQAEHDFAWRAGD